MAYELFLLHIIREESYASVELPIDSSGTRLGECEVGLLIGTLELVAIASAWATSPDGISAPSSSRACLLLSILFGEAFDM